MDVRVVTLRMLTATLTLSLSASAVSASAVLGAPEAAATATPAATTTVLTDGPDVSSYQHPNGAAISWAAVRSSGREFAIVKATEGTSYVNPWFHRDYAGITAAGLVRGSYHFAHPAHPLASSAANQAAFYVARLGSVTGIRTLPPVLDLEVSGGLSRAELVIWAQDFLLDVRHATGRTPMLYTYPYFWQHSLGDPAALARYPLWMAAYSGAVDPSAALWQYTQSARIGGIRGAVDMSRLQSSGAWPTLSDGRVPTPWAASAPGQVQRLVASAGVRSATVTWLTPDAGTSPLTGYIVRVVETGQQIVVGPTATSATMTGLKVGGGYTLSVTPRNAVGRGVPASSGQVVPVAPVTLTTTASHSAVVFGDTTVSYAGTLRDGDTGAPLAGRTVAIFKRPLGSTAWSLLQRATTDEGGVVRQTITAGRTVQVRMYFAGEPARSAASTLTTTLVRSSVTAHLSSTHLAPGVRGILSGTIGPRYGGVRVWRQIRISAGHWQSVATTTTTTLGTFRFAVGAKHPSSATMRVLVAASGGRAVGWSPAVRLIIS